MYNTQALQWQSQQMYLQIENWKLKHDLRAFERYRPTISMHL